MITIKYPSPTLIVSNPRMSFFQVIFLSGCLPVRSFLCIVVFLSGCLSVRLSTCQQFFLSGCLPAHILCKYKYIKRTFKNPAYCILQGFAYEAYLASLLSHFAFTAMLTHLRHTVTPSRLIWVSYCSWPINCHFVQIEIYQNFL